MIADYGIAIEIFGFVFIFSHIWENIFRIIDAKIKKIKKYQFPSDPISLFNKFYLVDLTTISLGRKVHSYVRNLGVIFVILGLILQHSEINKWFFTNFGT